MICYGLPSAGQKNSWVHVSRLKNITVVLCFLLLVAGADDADCCLLLLEKLVDLARAVYGRNKFRKFFSIRPSVSRPSLLWLLHRTLEDHFQDPGMCVP